MTWALPLDGRLGDDVAHAPTATSEALALPARLIATLPLEPDRRRVRLGIGARELFCDRVEVEQVGRRVRDEADQPPRFGGIEVGRIATTSLTIADVDAAAGARARAL